VVQILSFCDQPRKRGNCHGVSALFVGFKKGGVFVGATLTFLNKAILIQMS
jgi:hypothetical protein